MIKVINRSMSIPIPERTVGYSGDNLVETRTFELNRLYGDVDLAEFDFKLDTQVGDIKNIINLEKTVTEDKIVLTWVIAESHVLYAGIMSIQLRAFKGEVEKWHSAQGYVQVQPSINAAQTIPDPLPSEFEQMEQRVTQAKNETIEAAQEAKQQAERVEDIIQEAEQDVLPELRQAIEDGIETKDQLGGSIQEAGEAKTALDGSISSAGTAKGELDGSITEANTAKGQLDDSIDLAGNAKTELDGSITIAEQTKQALDESIATGDLVAFRQEFTEHKNDYASYKDSNNLKIAKVEKEFNDYRSIIQQLNPNQDAKQSVSGYGIVHLPKNAANGQISVTVKGNTETDEEGNTKSTVSAMRLKSVGKNLFPFGDIDNTERSSQNTTSFIGYIPVEPNKTYTLSGEKIGGIPFNTNDRFWGVPLPYNMGAISWFDVSAMVASHERFYLSGASAGTETRKRDSKTIPPNCTVLAIFAYSISGNNTIYTNIQLEKGTIATPYEPYTESTAYTPSGEPLRSLPNGTKDELNVTDGKLTKRVSDKFITNSANISGYVSASTVNVDVVVFPLTNFPNLVPQTAGLDGSFIIEGTLGEINISNRDNVNSIGKWYTHPPVNQLGFVVAKGSYSSLANAQANFPPQTLNYQLAEPIVTPISVSGILLSYPSGTIYTEPIIADAGLYTDNMAILNQDLPIKRLDKLSVVDFLTGVETNLDVSEVVIAVDGLSFTHPGLSEGNIVFFEYEYDVESTEGETEVEFYDSRYVVKDDVTGKFYKWNVKVSNGTPTIEVVEV